MKPLSFFLLLSFSRYFALMSKFSFYDISPHSSVLTTSQLEAPVLVNGVLNELYDSFEFNGTTEYLFEYTHTTSELGKY